jgi:hypothetical protein
MGKIKDEHNRSHDIKDLWEEFSIRQKFGMSMTAINVSVTQGDVKVKELRLAIDLPNAKVITGELDTKYADIIAYGSRDVYIASAIASAEVSKYTQIIVNGLEDIEGVQAWKVAWELIGEYITITCWLVTHDEDRILFKQDD